VGILNKTYEVYCDSEIADGKILMGYKGRESTTDSGYFYCPYVPVMSTGIVVDPLTYQPQINFMTRYGKVIIQSTELSVTEKDDGSSCETLDKQSSNYFTELNFEGIHEVYKMICDVRKIKGETPEKVEVNEEFNAFDDALNVVD